MSESTWQPGDPLHSPNGVYVRPMFQLIEESHHNEPASDAASWPEPFRLHDLDKR